MNAYDKFLDILLFSKIFSRVPQIDVALNMPTRVDYIHPIVKSIINKPFLFALQIEQMNRKKRNSISIHLNY